MNNFFSRPYLRIALYYALFGLVWIVLTDRLVFALALNLEQMTLWQTYKGWFFVAASTLLIYLMLATADRKRHEVQNALANSERTYRQLFESNPLPMWVYDLETLAFLAVNEAAIAKYGYSGAEFLAMSIRDIRPPEDIPRLLADVDQTTRRLNFAGEWRHRRRDGSVFPVEVTSHELVYNGRSARLVTANDLTDRKQAETAAREKTEVLEKIFDNVPVMLGFIDQNGRVALANRAYEQTLGWSLSELQNHPDIFSELYPDPDYRAHVMETIYRGEGVFEEFHVHTRDGRVLDASFANVLLSDGTSIGIGRDITQDKAIENALKESEARFRRLAENAPDLIYRYRFLPEPGFEYVSPAATIITGYTPQDHYDDPQIGYKLVHPDDRHLLTAVSEGKLSVDEPLILRWLRKDGTIIWTEQRNVPVYNEASELIAIEGIARDVTEQTRTQQALRESERRFRTAIEEAPFPIIIHAEDGEILTMSRIWTEITGYQLDEIPTIADWTERAYGVRQKQVQAEIDQLYELDRRKDEGEFEITCKNGARRIWEFSSTPLGPLPDGRHIVISAAVDVTERKKAKAALQAKTEELDGYFKYSLDLLCIADTEGRFRRLNKEWETTLGYPLSKLEGQRFLNFVHPDDRAATLQTLSQLADQQEILNFVNRYRHQDGTYRWIEWRSTPVGDLIYAAARDITKRIENEQQLRLQSAALEATANGIVITDINGNVEWVNSAFTELTGFTAAEARGRNPRELVKSGKHDNLFYKEMWHTILSGRTWRGEIINKRKDGTLYTEEETITPVLDAQGSIAHFIAIKQDITQRKQVEDALRHSEASLAAAQKAAKLGSWEVDLITGKSIWSAEMYRLVGIDPANKPGLPEFLELIHPDDHSNVIEAYLLGKQTFELVTFEFRTKPEYGIRNLVGKFQTSADSSGQPVKMTGTVQDITDRKQAEAEREYLLEQVKAQAEQLSQVMRSVPEGVLLLDPSDEILLANPQGQEYLNVLANVAVGQKLTHLGDATLEAVQTSPQMGQWHEVKVNGRVFQIIARPVETGPVPQGWVLVLRDVTEQQEVQRQMQQQERLAAVGQLAAGIAHDFNNIMAVIILYAQILERSPELPTKQQQQLATITQQATQASELIQQILDFSRRSLLTKQRLDFLSLLQAEMTLLQHTLPENIVIKLVSEPGNYMVQADPTRLQQSIMNLAINARDAMPHGGQLRFDLTPIQVESSKHAPFPGMTAGNWIRLRVTDTGSGIEPDFLEHIFEPFFTTKEPGKGTGLGLAQVHGIIGQHGGYITLDSKVGIGTTFTIYLPALANPDLQTAANEADILPQGKGELLLVVEDKLALREALVESLSTWQYHILEAANGEEALTHLAQWGETIKLVISDVIMPQMGGIALLKSLRQQGWKMPVILMTGHPLDVPLPELAAQGVHVTLAKPINSASLAQAVASSLDQGENGHKQFN